MARVLVYETVEPQLFAASCSLAWDHRGEQVICSAAYMPSSLVSSSVPSAPRRFTTCLIVS